MQSFLPTIGDGISDGVCDVMCDVVCDASCDVVCASILIYGVELVMVLAMFFVMHIMMLYVKQQVQNITKRDHIFAVSK